MTLYYSLVFALLVLEMALFVTLIIPLPHSIKRKMFNFISESVIVAKLQYGLKITFIFITILFADSVNRVYRVQLEMAAFGKQSNAAAAAAMGTDRMEVQARKFYSQRNMYLTGFTLFLSLILNRMYLMILDQLRIEDKLMRYEGNPAGSSKESEKLGPRYRADEIGQLKKQLEHEKQDKENLKKQAEGLQREYDDLSAKFNQTNPGDKKGN
ncbi:Endoplasmic reticulum transmembrane protein 3 [Lithohypha guttulata]|uniref:Endoplasmic reticulum transmembrane protein n=1 Tax=Lithohypha guttulata TaxID=1690604 RepID=A0AAN7YKB0_9EURO|nr:Endoplasmic reticulum transmembrane protein 3 [Lithohypha guttulata]KAK5100412.1 Endoplasmic reticulum transmembrane protein 3 [Lithohypha guttulata]